MPLAVKKPLDLSQSHFAWFENILQTAAVICYVGVLFSTVFLFFLPLYVLFFTKYYYLSLIYYSWMWYDRDTCLQGGRRLEFLRHAPLCKFITNYFPVKVKTSVQLDPNKNYICGYHPHGLISIGAVSTFAFQTTNFTQKYPKIKPHLTISNFCHFVPFLREIFQIFGVCSSTKESISWLLNNGKGNMAVIIIGGFPEQGFTGTNKLVLLNRKGFVKLAIQSGATLIPVFAFGENNLFVRPDFQEGSLLQKFQDTFRKLTGWLPPIVFGRRVLPFTRLSFIPNKLPIEIVFGAPIDVNQNSNPVKDEINFYHNLYVQSLLKLFNEHKINYDQYKNVDLEIV